jgi:hypothetical protein
MSQSKAELVAPVGIFTASGINVTGVVTAVSFEGDGSQLQGVGIGTTGSVNSSGIITASAFYGSGIGLTGITLLGPTNSYETTGIITASAFYGDGIGITNIGGPLSPISYSPGIGQTNVGVSTNIVITFNKLIASAAATSGIATITLRTDAADGTIVESFDIADSAQLSISGGVLTITPSASMAGLTTHFLVIPAGTLQDTIDTSENIGITTYSFITTEITNYVTGELYVWGLNAYGQFGVNDTIARSSPTQIPGTQWTSLIGQGYLNTHAIKSDKTLWGMGYNVYGDLGVNDTLYRSSPVQVPGTQWGTVGNSYLGGLATKIDGTLWAWGYNNSGELGQNDRINRSSPVQIPGTQWVYNNPDLFGGGNYIDHMGHCVKTDGTLWVWGSNQYGGLGQNNQTAYSSPVQLPGTQWSNILLGGTSGGVKTDGTLWVWGISTYGAIGDNTTAIPRSSPIQIPGTQWSYFSGGTYYSCGATKTDGTLWMWGFNNVGQLGQNNVTYRSSPVQIPGTQWDTSRYGLSIGFYGSYAIKTDGTLWAWGQGVYGQLGQNNITYRSSPIQIPGTQWIAVPRQGAKVYSGFALKSAP